MSQALQSLSLPNAFKRPPLPPPLPTFSPVQPTATMDPKLKPAILIVSDTASQDPASDQTASALSSILAEEGKWEPPAIRIVPDNVFQIQQAVCDWTDGRNWYNLILLSGGTGFAVRDNTPEVRHFSSPWPWGT